MTEIHLIYYLDTKPGYTRIRKGDGFLFLNEKGEVIQDPKTLERLEHLAIPPVWEDVWISPLTEGHLQATGTDSAGRKQYLYHSDWVTIQQEAKFNKMVDFGTKLPNLRKKIRRDMKLPGIPYEKVLATIVWLLEKSLIRVGNEQYQKENHTYGLTTMKDRHVDIDGDTISFSFVGKSGIRHEMDVKNSEVAMIISSIQELPGQDLFQYLDDRSQVHDVTSEDVNQYLKSIAEEEITAKDFRTWGGTLTAADSLYNLGNYNTRKEERKNISTAVQAVAQLLGNKPTTSKKYYIHPRVIYTYQEKILVPYFEKKKLEFRETNQQWRIQEFALLELLKEYGS